MTLPKHKGKIISGNLPSEVFDLLQRTSLSLGLPYSQVLMRSLEYWMLCPPKEPASRRERGTPLRRVCLHFPKPLAHCLQAYSQQLECPPDRILESAFVQWFETIGGRLVYKVNQPVAEAVDRESIEILQRQLKHFQLAGNQIRVAQLRRELLAMGVAA